MPVFSRFDPTKAGDVNANAHPNVYSYPWIQQTGGIRSQPVAADAVGLAGRPVVQQKNFGTRTQRIQPNEKRAWFNPRGYSQASLIQQGSKTSCPCGGCSTEGGSRKDGTI
jgi:hypothetical protein